MSTIKKYVSFEKLGLYDGKIKKVISDGDAAALAAAKEYADGLASNYDAAGSAATAEANAKAYADGKDAAIQAAKDAADAAAAAAGVADGKAVAAQNAADAAQREVDALELLVGTLPEGTSAKDVVEYVNVKTAGIATDAALGELQGQLNGVQGEVNTIKGDYLKAADKTELEGKITAEETRATGVEGGLDTRIKAIEDDYLKAADKTELQNNINTVSGAVERLTNGVSAEEVDGVNDLIQYVKDHGTEVTGIKKDISDNATAIAEEVERAKGEESKNATAAANAKTAADEAAAAVVTEKERAMGVEGGLDTRLQAVEGKLGTGEGSVESMVSTAKQEAIDAAAQDATSKANTAELNAKSHADGLNTAMNTRVEALEAIDHDHSNKDVIDGITSTKVTNWDNAASKVHEHSNKAELDKIVDGDVAKWNAAEQNAKTYADGLNTAMDTRMQAVEAWQANLVECSEEDINGLFA